MSVWVCIPSARPVAEVEKWAAAWRAQGYKIALWRDGIELDENIAEAANLVHSQRTYPGYAVAVNHMVFLAMVNDPQADWMICAGDDIFPDPTRTAEQIASECRDHFMEMHHGAGVREAGIMGPLSTYGVMQPTGDPWADSQGRIIERIAGSAWYGREYCKRINQGKGPLWPEYHHMFVDEEAQLVAQKYGVFCQRPDLTQMHMHWGRPKPGERFGNIDNMPEFLKEANSPEHWGKYKAIFEARKAAGFPGSEPL